MQIKVSPVLAQSILELRGLRQEYRDAYAAWSELWQKGNIDTDPDLGKKTAKAAQKKDSISRQLDRAYEQVGYALEIAVRHIVDSNLQAVLDDQPD